MAKEFRHLGKATPRKDAQDIVTGRAKYIDDVSLPRMLHAGILGSPYAHAFIKNIDTAKAEACRGVRAVLTYKNCPDWKSGTPPHRRILDSTVRFVGDAVALVAAETREIAEEAVELIEVEYEELPAVYDVEEAIKPGAPQLYKEFPGNILPRGAPLFGPTTLQEIVIGDVVKGMKEADFVIEGTCAYDRIPNPLPPEPPGIIAHWEGSNQVTLWTASQSPGLTRLSGQPFLKLADVRVISAQCGGSYGTKNVMLTIVGHAAALARATGRPVKVYHSKEAHLTTGIVRLASRLHSWVGIKKDGTVTALAGEWLVGTGASSDLTQGMVSVACGEAQVMLRCPNWNLQPKVVCTNRTPSATVRGFGGQELKSALLPLLAQAMEKADVDPLEFFKKNFVKPGDGFYWRDGKWWVCKGVDYSRAMEKGAEAFAWKDKWKGWLRPSSVEGAKRRGVGVGLHGNADVGEDESEAYVKLNPDGTAVVHSCTSESGMGQRSSLCKMVAEVLDLPLDKVNLTPPDTLVNPFEFGLEGSRGTFAVGSAVIEAAEDARKKLLELAAPMLDTRPELLDTRDGLIFIRDDPKRAIPWKRAISLTRTVTGHGRFDPNYSFPNFMMIFAEVEVDIETGKTDLLRVIACTDCGQIIDPLALDGQLHGALGSAGIDTALFEESLLDKTTGRIVNCNMVDYKWRTYLDLPGFQNVILETPIDTHRFHAIGVGEISTAPGPSAVLMAISNAIGSRITEYPATPDKILRAIGRI